MRRAAVLLLFGLLTFVPSWLAARIGHLARDFVGPAGTWSWEGDLDPEGGGPPAHLHLALEVVHGNLDLDLGGPVDPGSLHVELTWETTGFDKAGRPYAGERGALRDGETRLAIDPDRGRITGRSPAVTMRGPARLRGGCGMGREFHARHRVRFTRDGRAYSFTLAVFFARRGSRIVTLDRGAAP